MIENNKEVLKNKFIDKSNKKHDGKYDYSLVEYVNSQTKVKIICPEHGILEQVPANHSNRYGCSSCGGTSKNKLCDFIKKANSIHNNKYDYSLVEYVNNKTKVKIICHEHGIFEQRPDNHLNGQRCGECHGTHLKTQDCFINECKGLHNNKYDYSLVEYVNAHTKVKIICHEHGIFERKPLILLRGYSCPLCNINISKGENFIINYLCENKIYYIQQYKFEGCVNKRQLLFDFYIPEYNMCIEFDGMQHFKSIDYYGGDNTFNIIKKRDGIKNKYCSENNINLLRIPYYDFKNIKVILESNLK